MISLFRRYPIASASTLTIVLFAGCFLAKAWRHTIDGQTALRLREQVKLYAQTGDFERAHALISEAELRSRDTERRDADWVRTKLDVAIALRDINGFEALAEAYPDAILEAEAAALFWGRICIHARDWEQLELIKRRWQGRASRTESWFFLELSEDLARGRTQEARQRIRESQFSGDAEAHRLIYQALEEAHDPQKVIELLVEAYRVQPQNTDVRTFLANAYEALGRDSLAQREYLAAYLIDRDNPILRDNLAEFYLRRGQLTRAITAWVSENDKAPVPDFIWFKAQFWNRVARGQTIPATIAKPTPLEPVAEALAELPRDRYFSSKIDHARGVIPKRGYSAENYLVWLSILEALRVGDESTALDQLQGEPSAIAMVSPLLGRALMKLLSFRLHDVLPEVDADFERPQHRFFRELMESTTSNTPTRALDFLNGPYALSALFASVGWLGTAIDYWPTNVQPLDRPPTWLSYAMGQAHRHCAGNAKALAFLNSTRDDAEEIVLLRAELLLAEGYKEQSRPLLETLASSTSDVGYRAAWLGAMSYLEEGNLVDAHKVLMTNTAFALSVSGQELQARIALARGLKGEAKVIYGRIAESSVEAHVYLASQAFKEADWEKAKQHTQGALALAPNQPGLVRNLQLISEKSRCANP